jgi:hypothetical protein
MRGFGLVGEVLIFGGCRKCVFCHPELVSGSKYNASRDPEINSGRQMDNEAPIILLWQINSG